MNHEEMPTDMAQSEENDVSLADVGRFIRDNLKPIIGLAVIGAVLGVGSTFVVQKQWEGKVTLQVGRSAGSPVVGPDGPLIESVQQTVGRVQLSAFRDGVASEIYPQLKADTDALHKTIVWKNLKARMVTGTVYVEISARGSSIKQAEQALQLASNQIITEHAAILDRARTLPKQQLSVIDAAIEANTKAQADLNTALANSKNTDSVMALSALQSSRAERATLNDSRYRVSQLLAPDQSYNTRIVSAIRVDEEPAFPRKVFFGLGGLTLGVIAGVIVGLSRKRSV
ncbi:hypothetical protein ACU80U_08745 [Pandoraea sputorum]